MSANPVTVLFEKAAATFVQVFLTVLLASKALTPLPDGWTIDVSLARGAAIAAVAAFLTVIANGAPTSTTWPFWVDLTYRCARTYSVSFLALWVGVNVGTRVELSEAKAAAVAAVPLVLAFAKGEIAKRYGKGSPALLTAGADYAPAA